MAQTVRLDDEFMTDVKVYAAAAHRSPPKQIEYWSKIGRIAEDNPDLTFSFIKDNLLAFEQVKEGQVTRYVRATKKDIAEIFEIKKSPLFTSYAEKNPPLK